MYNINFNPNISKDPKINEHLKEVFHKILQAFTVEEIVVCGSFGRANDREKFNPEWGDIDILVIGESTDRFVTRIRKLRELCSDGFLHINPLFYTRTELDAMIESGEGAIEDMLEEGVVIYKKNEC